MNIGIDIRTLMDAQYSGVSEYTLNLIKEILKLDSFQHGPVQVKNSYRLFYNSFHDVSQRLPKFNYNNVELVGKKYPNKILNYLLFKYLTYPKIDRLLGVDLFFMPHINFIALSSRCTSILTIHDLSFLRYPEFFSRRKNFWHRMINVRKLAKSFDQIIAVSENTKNDIIELCNINPERVKVIYSGIGEQNKAVSQNDKKLSDVKRKYNLPDKFILYLSTLEPRKNVEGIIRAFDRLKTKNKELTEVKLVIAGGRGWKLKNIFKAWQEAKYKDDIKFLGYVDASDKTYLYNLAILFVYPSFYEGFGFPPLEAMACGTPVITSFTSSLPEVVGKAAIMIDPYNIDDIAGAIEQVLTDRDLCNDLIKKGLERARQFSWQKSAKEYLEVFRGLV